MKKIAVFGNTGGGKSTLARRLAELTRIPLYPLDMIQYRAGGGKIPHEEYLKAHSELLQRDAWIIDGFLWVTKRFLKGLRVNPQGWPERSPIISSTISSYRVLWLCHRRLTPKYRELVSAPRHDQRVYHLKSAVAMEAFLSEVRLEALRA